LVFATVVQDVLFDKITNASKQLIDHLGFLAEKLE
jgi:hypothetical protein